MHYFEVKNEDGLTNLISVPTSHILPDSFEPYNVGHYEKGENGFVYTNSTYGLMTEFDSNSADIKIYNRYLSSGPCIITSELLSYTGSIETYEFFNKENFNDTEVVDFLSEQLNGSETFNEEVETFELGNKTNQKKIIEDHYTSEDINTGIKTDNVSTSILLYRYDENKIYTIHIYTEYNLNLLVPFTE